MRCLRGITGRSVRLSAEVYERYFGSVKSAKVAGIVEDALAAWFGKGELFSISIGLPSRIISMGGPGVWGRRYGTLWGMMCSR